MKLTVAGHCVEVSVEIVRQSVFKRVALNNPRKGRPSGMKQAEAPTQRTHHVAEPMSDPRSPHALVSGDSFEKGTVCSEP